MSYLDSIVSAVHYDKLTWGPNYLSDSSKLKNDETTLNLIVTKGEQFGQTADWSIGLTQDRRLGSQYIGKAKQTDQFASTKLYEVVDTFVTLQFQFCSYSVIRSSVYPLFLITVDIVFFRPHLHEKTQCYFCSGNKKLQRKCSKIR